jgi:hypothetical protein
MNRESQFSLQQDTFTYSQKQEESIFDSPLFDWHIDQFCEKNKINKVDLARNTELFDFIQSGYTEWYKDMQSIPTLTEISVNLLIEGFHNFPQAIQTFGEEVDFLRHRHRHIFQINVRKTVNHDDRDIEFILFKRKIEKWIKYVYQVNGACEFKNLSCEMIARIILYQFDASQVTVSEDGENAAIVTKL